MSGRKHFLHRLKLWKMFILQQPWRIKTTKLTAQVWKIATQTFLLWWVNCFTFLFLFHFHVVLIVNSSAAARLCSRTSFPWFSLLRFFPLPSPRLLSRPIPKHLSRCWPRWSNATRKCCMFESCSSWLWKLKTVLKFRNENRYEKHGRKKNM